MFTLKHKSRSLARAVSLGFSLTELMVAVTIFSTVVTGAAITFAMGIRAYRAASAETDASCQVSTTLTRMAYGIGENSGLRAAFAPITATSGNTGWNLTFTIPKGQSGADTQVNQIHYNKSARTISYKDGDNNTWTVIGKNIVNSTVSSSASGVNVMIQAQSVIGNQTTINEMSSIISFRN